MSPAVRLVRPSLCTASLTAISVAVGGPVGNDKQGVTRQGVSAHFGETRAHR